MPIVIRTRSKRLTNDQHRVELIARDVSLGEAGTLEDSDSSFQTADAPKENSATHTIAYDVYVSWPGEDVEDSGHSRKPDQILEDFPTEGAKCIVWRGLPLGTKQSFLVRRTRPGAYTVELRAEAHIRVMAGGRIETVTFPPTP